MREMGEREVGPGGDEPVAIAVVEKFGGLAVGVGEIGVELGRTSKSFEGGGVVRVLPIEGDGGEGGGRLFAPEAVGVFLADKAGEHWAAEGGPIGIGEDFAAEEDSEGVEGVVFW